MEPFVADIFHEVDEEVRRDQLKKLWDRYSIYLIAAAVLIVAGIGAWRGYEYWVAKQAAAAAKAKAFYDDLGHLAYFRGSHPRVMAPLIAAQDWHFDHGIEAQAPAWLRHLEIALLYPFQKRWRRWKSA